MIRNNYKKAEKKFLIFPNMKSVDQILCLSLCFALFCFVLTLGQASLLGWLIFFIVLCCAQDVFVRIYRGKSYVKKYASEEAVIFNGPIEELTLALYDNDFRLKNKIGEFYIFCSSFFLLPKCEAVVSVHGNKCLLHASKGRIIQLCEVINFEDVTTDSNQDSKNCNGNRNE